jgi:UDP-2,3-diacylglucosamine pyrophosphatase LpxH
MVRTTIRFRSIFLSDTHLGSHRAHADRLLHFLERCDSDYLYLVGDIADRWGPRGSSDWPDAHAEVLALVQQKAKCGTRVHFLPGNHDRELHRWMTQEALVNVSSEHEHTAADGRKLLVLHGDHFDTVVSRVVWLSKLGDSFGNLIDIASALIERILPRQKPGGLGTRIKQICKRALGYTGRFERSAIRSARMRKLDGIICGHIHDPACRVVDGMFYGNNGDWVQSCTALVEHADGTFELLEWPLEEDSAA